MNRGLCLFCVEAFFIVLLLPPWRQHCVRCWLHSQGIVLTAAFFYGLERQFPSPSFPVPSFLSSSLPHFSTFSFFFSASDPPEVTSSERTVHAWPGGRADLTCIVKAEPRATVCQSEASYAIMLGFHWPFRATRRNKSREVGTLLLPSP